MSDDYLPEETSAEELFNIWARKVDKNDLYSKALGKPWVSISWGVWAKEGPMGAEYAPFGNELAEDPPRENFLTFYTWPIDAETGERLNWLRLPIPDKLWRPGQAHNRGGFIQEHTGWKPSAFQQVVNLDVLRSAAGY